MNFKILITLISINLFIGCASKTSIIDFDKTNPVKIEESVKGLNIVDFVSGKITKSEPIILKSIEQPMFFTGISNGTKYNISTKALDWGTKYLIEDNLITSLLDNGFRVLERDPEVMESLFSESGERYALLNFEEIYGFDKDNEDKSEKKGIEISRDFLNELIKSKNVSDEKSESSRKYQLLTDLYSADKLLTYRVLECGIIYKNIDMDLINVQRLARTRLHCRLENAKTGEILSSGIIENEIKDIIPRDKIKEYEEMHYTFYNHSLPNMTGINKNKTPTIKSASSTPGVNLKGIVYLIAGGFLLLLLI